MKDISLKITEEDIKEYLKKHKNDINIKYKEAMFIKNLRDNRFSLTKEMIQVLFSKHFNCDCDTGMLEIFYSRTIFPRNLDISGICHILIPTLKYYGQDKIGINRFYTNLDIVADRLVVSMDHPMSIIENTLDDYRICGKVETNSNMIWIKMGRENCRRELLAYQDFYDENKVKRIKKIMREDLR